MKSPAQTTAATAQCGQSIAHALFSSLASGAQFYFLDADLPGGVNRLTCFRKTPTGYTNLVTGRHTRSNADFMVQPAHGGLEAIGQGIDEVHGEVRS